uniref:Ribonuclease H2 subunit B n=1 Tax=Culicoides sonorensis TaxID=179676 RepID=A0A336L7L7_CULSO
MENKFGTKIFILDETLRGQKLKSIKLKHPGNDKQAVFLLCESRKEIYELLSFNEKHRSWFIDESVASNGQIYMPMIIDPLYIVLSYLVKCDPKKVQPIQHVLEDSEFHDIKYLMNVIDVKELKMVHQIGPEDINAFKYNESKALEWLKKKCLIVVEALKKSNVRTGQNVTSQTYVNVNGNSDENAYLLTAHGIVSEYISMELSTKLSSFMNIVDESKQVNGAKRKSIVDLENVNMKKSRLSDETNFKVNEPETKESKKAKQKNEKLAKAATGSKNILSFFNKKS